MEIIPPYPSPRRGSSSSMSSYSPHRPPLIANYVAVPLVCNSFDIFHKMAEYINQYPIKFEPPIADDARDIRNQLLDKYKREIRMEVGSFVHSGASIFAFGEIAQGTELAFGTPQDTHRLIVQSVGKKVDWEYLANSSHGMSSSSSEMIGSGDKNPSAEM